MQKEQPTENQELHEYHQPYEHKNSYQYQYSQRPLSEDLYYQQNGQYEYPPTAMEHTVVLKPVVSEQIESHGTDEKKSDSPKSSRKVFWGFLILFLMGTGAILTGVYVSRQQQQQKNSDSSSLNNNLPFSNISVSSSSSSSTRTAGLATATSEPLVSTTRSSTGATPTLQSTNVTTNNVIQPTFGLPKDVGNCVSGSYPFASSRAATFGYSGAVDPSFDTNAYDFIIPYNTGNVQLDGTLKINLIRNNGASASGAILTSSRYMWYGKFSVTIQAINVGGAITNFITLSDSGDEIDIEICGKPVAPYTNVFYDTVGKSDEQKEYFTHFDIINGIDMSVPHTYTIDWKHDSLTWLVDGVVVRTLLKSQSLSSLNPSGPKWFPETPSLIQFGVWDASYAADPRTVDWAGGPIQWGGNSQFTATYSNFEVTCYDPNDNAVPRWP